MTDNNTETYYLVIGDSFAIYDLDGNSHWLRLWAEKHKSTTSHIAVAGGSPTEIYSSFINTNFDWEKVKGVFYLVTDLFRVKPYEIRSMFVNHCPISIIDATDGNTAEDIIINQLPISENNTQNEPELMKFIVNSNLAAIHAIVNETKIHNKPLCMIDTFVQQAVITRNKIMKIENSFAFADHSIDIQGELKNHLSYESAKLLADKFYKIINPETLSVKNETDKVDKESLARQRIENIRKSDPFIYR